MVQSLFLKLPLERIFKHDGDIGLHRVNSTRFSRLVQKNYSRHQVQSTSKEAAKVKNWILARG
jgi:hypothetical protein